MAVACRRVLPLGLAVLLAAAGCQRAPAGPPNVLVVVVDTLRADRLGAYGNRRGLTPFLDQLAARGARFQRAYAPSAWTVPSIASLFTSRYPAQHQVNQEDSKLSDAEVTLAEILSAHGFQLAGFTANFRLTAPLGYAQGFDSWQAFPPTAPGAVKTRGDVLRAAALAWLDAAAANRSTAPKLLYLQYMEPHGPYEPPPDLRQRFAAEACAGVDVAAANAKILLPIDPTVTPAEVAALAALYDGEVAAVDGELRALFAELERRDFLRDAVVVVTADHGEEFHEHGRMGHGLDMYDEVLRVPLLVLAPGVAAGTVVEDPVSLVDVAPTLLDLAGLRPEARFEGRSLVPLLRGAPPPDAASRPIISQLLPNGGDPDLRVHTTALVRGPLKLLEWRWGQPAVFDLAADPGEQRPNGPGTDGQLSALRAALDALEVALLARAAEPESAPVDPATREKLRALGYNF